MKNIAILFGYDKYTPDDYFSSAEFIAERLTEFEEVSDEDFELLMRYRGMLGKNKIFIFEKPNNPQEVIKETVSDCLKYLHEEQEKSAKEEQKRKALAEKRKLQTLERKKKQLEKLKKEFGEE